MGRWCIVNRDEQIRSRLNAILCRLDKQARTDRCKGDMVCGWDWPTLCIVLPDVAQEIASLRREWRGLKSAGLTNERGAA
jgi:hypothetical protein